MYGNLNNDYMPRIHSFFDAEDFYENTKPIRKQTKEDAGVPLHSERRQWDIKSLHKLSDDVYAFRFYSTDVLKLHRNGDIEIDVSYGSMSTDSWFNYFSSNLVDTAHHYYNPFMNLASEHDLLWLNPSIVDDDQRIQWENETARNERNNRMAFFTDDDTFYLEYMGNNKYHVRNPAPRYQKLVVKSKAHEIRKPYQEFIKYLKIFETTPLTLEAYRELSGKYYLLSEFIKDPTNRETWGNVAADFHTRDYRGFYDENRNWQYKHVMALRPMKAIKSEIYKLAYEVAGTTKFVQLPFGHCKNARLFTESEV